MKRVLLYITIISLIFSLGYYSKREEWYTNKIKPLIVQTLNYFQYSFDSNNEVGKIYLTIAPNQFRKLEKARKNALENQILTKKDKFYVPASLEYDNKKYDIKLRLKGDFTDHLISYKWSFRVKLKEEEELMGMQVFSLQRPGTRDYLTELIYHRFMKKENLPALDYDFINLIVNGKNFGIYALEGHFDRLFFEKNNIEKGLVLKFDDDNHYKEISQRVKLYNSPYPKMSEEIGFNSLYSTSIIAYNMKEVSKDTILYEQFNIARGLLEKYRREELLASEVFDIPKTAKFLAVSELLGARHNYNIWQNYRFYFNPSTSLIQPLAFDASAIYLLKDKGLLNEFLDGVGKGNHIILTGLLRDNYFVDEYMKNLHRVSKEDFLDDFLEEYYLNLEECQKLLMGEFGENYDRKLDDYFQSYKMNQQYIEIALDPVNSVNAYISQISNDSVFLLLSPTQAMPINIIGISSNGVYLDTISRFRLSGMTLEEPLKYKNCEFRLAMPITYKDDLPKIKLHYNIIGSNKKKTTKVIPWPPD